MKNVHVDFLACLSVTHANWKLMKEMDHIDRLRSSQQRQPRGHIWKRGWEMDSSPRTSHVIHLWETPDSIQWRKVRENTLFLFNFSKSFTNSHCAGDGGRTTPIVGSLQLSKYKIAFFFFTSLAASSVGTRRHAAYQQTQTRMFFFINLSIKEQLSQINVLGVRRGSKSAFVRKWKVAFECSVGWLNWGWLWSKSCSACKLPLRNF